jgi:hypothetical protein
MEEPAEAWPTVVRTTICQALMLFNAVVRLVYAWDEVIGSELPVG